MGNLNPIHLPSSLGKPGSGLAFPLYATGFAEVIMRSLLQSQATRAKPP